MKRYEMIEILMKKANVNNEEAQAALEICEWDLLDAVVYLERRGKVENNETTSIIKVKEEKQEKREDNINHDKKFYGLGKIIEKVFKFTGKIIRKGNENFLEVRKENEKTIRLSLTISALSLIFLSVPSIVLLIVGLFCGYKYSISGPKVNYDGVNNIFEEVSKSADSIKRDFNQGYQR